MMAQIDFQHVRVARNKGKKNKYYFHKYRGTVRARKPIALPDDPNSIEFIMAWKKCMGIHIPVDNSNNFKSLISQYKKSAEYIQLAKSTQDWYSTYLKEILRTWGKLDVAKIKASHILAFRDKYLDRPTTGNAYLKTLNTLIKWGIPHDFREDNPCVHVRKLKVKSDGYPPWRDDDIAHFMEHASKTYGDVVQLALYTGQRRSDLIKMKWADIDERGFIYVIQQKTGKHVWVAIHPILRAVIDKIEKVGEFILTNDSDKPWSQEALKTGMRRILNTDIMLPLKEKNLTLHGLRKSATEKLYEADCNKKEIAAITGMSYETINHYLAYFDHTKLAQNAIDKWLKNDEK